MGMRANSDGLRSTNLPPKTCRASIARLIWVRLGSSSAGRFCCNASSSAAAFRALTLPILNSLRVK